MNIKATLALTAIEKSLQAGQLDDVLETCRETLKRARTENDVESETVALMGLAQVHQYFGKQREARLYADGGLQSAQEVGQSDLLVMALNTSASVFFVTSFKIDEAEADYRSALQLAHEIEDKRGIATALAGIAAIFNHARQVNRAITYAREAFEFAREADAPFIMATTLGIMGNVFVQQNQHEKALQAFDDALQVCEDHNIKFLIGYLLGNKGQLYTEDARYFDDGLDLLNKALAISRKINCVPHEFAALHVLGMARMRVEQFDLATEYFESMLHLAQHLTNRAYEGMSFYELGRLHIRAEQYDRAIDNFNQVLTISRETMNPFYEAQTESALGLCFSLKQEYELALSHYMAARNLYDALEDDSRMRDMTRAIILTHINRVIDRLLRFLGIRHDKKEPDENDDSQPMT